MSNITTKPNILFVLLSFGVLTCSSDKKRSNTDFGLKLPDGFKAVTVVEQFGPNRHIVVNSNGDIYINLGSLKDGKGIFVLRNVKDKYEVVKSFGNYGGTGIAIKNGYLYASSNSEIFRYKLDATNQVADPDHPEKIVTGLVDQSEHNSKSITLDNAGNVYV